MEESHTPPDICERTFEFAISGHRALAPTATVKESLTTQIQRRRAGNLCARLKNILASNELQENSVVRKFRITAAEGKSYDTQHYNLDAIISVGVEWRLSYRYAVPSHSPGLPGTGYPGNTIPSKSQPRRGCVFPTTPCLNPSPPFTSTLSFPPKTASHSSVIPLSVPKPMPISAGSPNNSTARPSSSAAWMTTSTSSPATPAPSPKPIGSRNSSASPVSGSNNAIHHSATSPGNPVMASSPSAPPILKRSNDISPIRKNTTARPHFRTNTVPSSNATPSHGMKNTSGIESMESRWDISISYRNAVPSNSPGLAHRAYPGTTRLAFIHTATRFYPTAQGCASRYPGITRPAIIHTATRFYPIAQGCASRYPGNMSQRFINPVGVYCIVPGFSRVAPARQPFAMIRNPVGICG